MKKILLHCNTSQNAVHSKDSKILFEKYVYLFRSINLELGKKLTNIFHKLKQGHGISEEEYNIFSMFLKHEESKNNLNSIIESHLTVPQGKGKAVEFGTLRIYIESLLQSSRAIYILQHERYRTPIKQFDNKRYIGVINKGKNGGEMYFEILEETDIFYICKNLRGGRNIIICKSDFNFCYESMGEVVISKAPFSDFLLVNHTKLVHPKGVIHMQSKDADFYEDKFFYYVIDGGSQNIHRIDKKSFESRDEGTASIIIKVRKGRYLVAEDRNNLGSYKLFELTGTLKIKRDISSFRQNDENLIIVNDDGIEEIL